MSSSTINIHEAKTHLSKILKRAEAGEVIIIARAGRPIAKLVAIHDDVNERRAGRYAGLGSISEDFDDSLPSETLEAFYR